MKKIINGKKYDTENAEILGYRNNDYFPEDFRFCEETLYRTPSGRYFLFGEGGPLSNYAALQGGGYTSSGRIIPLLEKRAQRWAERYLSADEAEAAFGAAEEA